MSSNTALAMLLSGQSDEAGLRFPPVSLPGFLPTIMLAAVVYM